MRALSVADFMTEPVFAALPSDSLERAARSMRELRVSGLPVVDRRDRLVGVISERDIVEGLERTVGATQDRGVLELLLAVSVPGRPSRLRECQRYLRTTSVSRAMSAPALAVAPDLSARAAAEKMVEYGVKRLPVVAGGRVVGIVTRQDLLGAGASIGRFPGGGRPRRAAAPHRLHSERSLGPLAELELNE